jgi:hypothetical protein
MAILSKSAAVISISIFVVNGALADDWYVRRQTTNGACHVQDATVRPTLGNDLAKCKSRKEACAKAKDLYDGSAPDPKKCFSYGGGTVDACKKEGVSLP